MQFSTHKSLTAVLFSSFAILTGGVRAAEVPSTNALPVAAVAATTNSASAAIGFFQNKVLPILKDNCYDCHSADAKISGGLRLDDHEGVLKGGDTGPAIVTGDPEKSLLIQRLHAENPNQRMPKNSDPLTDDEVAVLKTWIKDGVAWSDDNSPAVAHVDKSKIVDNALAAAGTAKPGDQVEFFEKKIRPIFVSHCYNCHSADTKPAGGLRVDDLDGLLTGGDEGPGIVPGKPDDSLVLERVLSENPKRRMPKEGDLLTETEIADLAVWIKNGAAWPREQIPANIGKIRADYVSLRTNHWAWQPLRAPSIPAVADD